MKILLRREQRKAMLGGTPVFKLTVRADLTDEEQAAVFKYDLSSTSLYVNRMPRDGGDTFVGITKAALSNATLTTLQVHDLFKGKVIECRDIVEMLGIEAQIRDAALMFKQILEAAMHFGGEEVMEL